MKKNSDAISEKLIRVPQKNDESQNLGQITDLGLSLDKEVEVSEDSKTGVTKDSDNKDIDLIQNFKTDSIDKGFFKRTEINSKILDSDNDILQKTKLLKNNNPVSNNFFIILITILGVCFTFIFIFLKKKKRVKKDID